MIPHGDLATRVREHALVQVCFESGAAVACHVGLAHMNLDEPVSDERCLEVVANGVALCHSFQVALAAAIVSPLTLTLTACLGAAAEDEACPVAVLRERSPACTEWAVHCIAAAHAWARAFAPVHHFVGACDARRPPDRPERIAKPDGWQTDTEFFLPCPPAAAFSAPHHPALPGLSACRCVDPSPSHPQRSLTNCAA